MFPICVISLDIFISFLASLCVSVWNTCLCPWRWAARTNEPCHFRDKEREERRLTLRSTRLFCNLTSLAAGLNLLSLKCNRRCIAMTLSPDAFGPCNPSQSFFITQEMERLILSRIAPTPSPASVFIRPHLYAPHHEKVLRLRNTHLNTFIYILLFGVCSHGKFYSVFGWFILPEPICSFI